MRIYAAYPDYEVTKKNYENLLARRESGPDSGDMKHIERHGLQGRRPAPGTVGPQKRQPPTADVSVYSWRSRGVSRVLPGGAEQHTIDDERRLSEVSELPILGTIMMAWTDAQERAELEGWSSGSFLGRFVFDLRRDHGGHFFLTAARG